jgi:hypothetical protein
MEQRRATFRKMPRLIVLKLMIVLSHRVPQHDKCTMQNPLPCPVYLYPS